MPSVRLWGVLLLATMGFTPPQVSPPPKIALLQAIRLPVSTSRGRYAHWPYYGETAQDYFSMRVAPDQSILVFDTDANTGHWPLVRLKNWWTTTPMTDVLEVPGWSSIEAKPYNSVFIDVQVDPDGRHAVVFSGMMWKNDSHKPDTIVTVVDLQQWKIIKSIHTAELGMPRVTQARVVANNWLMVSGGIGSISQDRTVPRLNLLLSIPELNRGAECTSHVVDLFMTVPRSSLASLRSANDAACQELLAATGLLGSEAMETRLERNTDPVPAHLESRHDHEALAYWGEYPYFDITWENPAFQATSRAWYALSGDYGGFYGLGVYDAEGTKLRSQPIDHSLCGDKSLGRVNSACGCRIIGVSEEAKSILTICRQQRHDFSDPTQREWLALIRSDDFSSPGIVDLNHRRTEFPALATHEGRAYVVTLARGEVLSVYGRSPDR